MGQLRLALWELRQEEEELQPERKRLPPTGWKKLRVDETKDLAMERNILNRGSVGKAKVKEALSRDLLFWCERQSNMEASIRGGGSRYASRSDSRVGTEQSQFLETLTGSDSREHLHDSSGSKMLTTILAVLESSRERTTRWSGMAQARD